jgi:hypothetical protein
LKGNYILTSGGCGSWPGGREVWRSCHPAPTIYYCGVSHSCL